MAAGITELRAHIKTVLMAEFTAEAIPVRDDRLHPSLGRDGPVAGVSPLRTGLNAGAHQIAQHEIGVQLYAKYVTDAVDPALAVDPAPIEAWAERFLRRVESQAFVPSSRLWYCMVVGIDYPEDPMGNITRFEATVRGYGQDPSLIETTG